ncbi:MAG: 50S ribosomal protein L29 [Thermoprotei archaeon]|nr:MAG: 50S ribosomal protein L29 [Thermoprotei archaeon]
MAILRAKDIRSMKREDRRKKLEELRAELINLRAQASIAGGMVSNPARIREIRKAIARILTIEREDELKRQR